MTLRDHFRSLLPARVRGGGPAGEVEFVVIEADGEDFVRATVHGHESHDVSLRLAPPAAWSAACTCPLFRRSGACRHLWAVVSEVDERGLPLADSVILATARAHGATLWTQDEDFRGLDSVEYTAK